MIKNACVGDMEIYHERDMEEDPESACHGMNTEEWFWIWKKLMCTK